MKVKTKLINIRISPEEYEEIKKLADAHGMSLSLYVRYMATIFLSNHQDINELTAGLSKNQLESDLSALTRNLEKQRRYIDMLIRSVNSTALKLESQIKKLRIESTRELHKDVQRINYLMESEDQNKSDTLK